MLTETHFPTKLDNTNLILQGGVSLGGSIQNYSPFVAGSVAPGNLKISLFFRPFYVVFRVGVNGAFNRAWAPGDVIYIQGRFAIHFFENLISYFFLATNSGELPGLLVDVRDYTTGLTINMNNLWRCMNSVPPNLTNIFVIESIF